MEPNTQDCGQLALAQSTPAYSRLRRERGDNFISFKMYLLVWNAAILGILSPQVLCVKEQYDGDQVLQIIPQNVTQVQCLKDTFQSSMFDLWKPLQPEDINVRTIVHVRIPSSALQSVKEDLLHCSLSFKILIDNVLHLIGRNTENKKVRLKRSLENYNYTKYHSMEEIYYWINQMSERNRDLVTQHFLGTTYEARPMQYLKISQPSNQDKKIVWMDCGIHAREWIAPAFCQWFVKEIVQNHENDPKIRKILQNIDLYVLPVFNIDGYIYSWTHERLWRKSRSRHENGTCYGVDLNRNFDINWCARGSSTNCSIDSFCGTAPASEPETKAVVDFIEKKKADIISYLTIHSYGQLILTSYGYTTELPRNYNEMIKVAQMAATELKKKHGMDYTVGTFAELLYKASGTSQDWVHDLGIDFSFTLELRDNGTLQFILPEDQIRPTCEETMAAVMTIIEYVNDTYFPNKASAISTSLWLSLLTYVFLEIL
ncbi:carboxypeptidase O-like [Pelobates fuscus]|uniref:carboxypeptidase O-like n=1 Tax=Pelobates fuscus TaxID=191477 RepID=UPI002FE48D44